ncbi:hypothetical protein ACEWY4_012320 [Coilia grayii]|uniref:Gypsy retrotransposon integrase-like protein 1 n=1 Tax=Coilia grayii TaxID=363190 RepID=A0ABD1K062_9TELE
MLEAIKAQPEPLCIYTDSRYAFGVVHDFITQWQLRHFLTSAGTPVRHFDTITAIWDAVQAHKNTISVVKIRAHITKNPTVHEQNNNIVDKLAKKAAMEGEQWKPLIPSALPIAAIKPTPIDLKQYQKDLWASDTQLVPYLQNEPMITIQEGIVLYDNKYVVPEALYKPVIKLYHEYAHVSSANTAQMIKRYFWWPTLASDVTNWCEACLVCAAINQGVPGRTKLHRPVPPKGPWENLQMDFIGPLPNAKGGYRYCLVIIDKFSKWVEAIPTRNNTAHTVARVLANQIIPLYGAPVQIESDQGTHFTGQIVNDMCKLLNIEQRLHIPYRPQSSGMVERANRTIKEQIAKHIAQHNNKWIDALPTVLTVLRATPSKATGISPYELMTGRIMRLPIDPNISPADLGPLTVARQQTVLSQIQERLKVLHAQATLRQQQSDSMNEAHFNPSSEVKFAEGDMVMVRVFVKENAFAPRWHGPYEVKAVSNSCLAVSTRGKLRWFATAIPWTPDIRKVSGPTCIRAGQRVQLAHNFGCGRWVWKLMKGPYTPLTSLAPRELVTWPPGVAPEPNCDTQICCGAGSTHLPTKNTTGYIQYSPELHNLTVWYQLKSRPDSNIGLMHIMYRLPNKGQDPKKCYRTRDLEPYAYRCTHTGPHNATHIEYIDTTFNLSLPTADENKPKPFVWTTRKEGVSSTQWCVTSEMNSFTYGGLTCPANHSFCLEVTEDFSMGQVHILGRTPLDTDASPWWEDTFYEESTQALADTMNLVQQLILQVDYHLNQAQVQTNLAKKTAEILTSSTTRAALYTYTWWDWMFRGCVIASALILTITMIQCCYFRHLIRSLRRDTGAALVLNQFRAPAQRRY